MLTQVTYIFGDTLDDGCILPTGTDAILLNLVIANELIKFCSKFCVVHISIEFRAEVECVLCRKIAFEPNDCLFEILELLLLRTNVFTQFF